LFYFLEGFVIYFLCGMKKFKTTGLNNVVMERQPANSVLNEDSQSLNNIKREPELSESQTTITTDYKNPEQGSITEINSPVTISDTNNAVLLQYESDFNSVLDSKMSDDLQSEAYMDKSESIVNFNAAAAGSNAHYVNELESKNSVIPHTAALSSTDKSSVVEETTFSTVPHVPASVVFPPADVSLSSEHVQPIDVRDIKRLHRVSSARNLYPNVIIYNDFDEETPEQDRQKIPEHDEETREQDRQKVPEHDEETPEQDRQKVPEHDEETREQD
jgi:hypothetical protein